MKRVRITNETVNSFGFRVLTSGLDVSQYERNPVLLYMHNRGQVIGLVKELKVENGEVTGELCFDEATDLSRQCKKQWEFGSLKMVSMGFVPQEVSDAPELLAEGQTRPTVTKGKLVEVSLVDIGSNDDALVLGADGEKIDLSLNGIHGILTPIKTKREMELKTIALALGLAAEATEQEVLAKIGTCTLVDKQEFERLRQENATLKEAGIVVLVDAAIGEKKIGAEKKDQFVTLGKQIGQDELKKVFDAMAPVVKLSQVIAPGGEAPGTTAWKKLSEVPEKELLKLRQEKPEEYKALYKAEYGIECEI